MRPATRPPPPDIPLKKIRAWAERYKQRRREKTNPPFQWPQYQRNKLNRVFGAILRTMTQDHCAYCDFYPTFGQGFESIDHFRPKSKFPGAAFNWKNLYLACNHCQNIKLERVSLFLLRPDHPNFQFDRYFLYNPLNGKIEVNPAGSWLEQHRAKVSIAIFGFNEVPMPTLRKQALGMFKTLPEKERRAYLDCLAFRFVLETMIS